MTGRPHALRSAQSVAAETAFKARLADLGAELLEQEWLGSGTPHRVRCSAGHICNPRPYSVKAGQGICRACAGNDPAIAEARFRTALAELGATLLEPGWLGCFRPHRVRCAAGHECRPRPSTVLHNGQGICRACAGLDPVATEAAFRAKLDELGVTLLQPYRNAVSRHRARCAEGHECWPQPHSVMRGKGACRACAGQDPAAAEAAFRAKVTARGGTVVGEYVNTHTPVHVICAAGHDWWPRPMVVQRGHGICRECAYKTWDVFYVVTHATEPRVKFGISNTDGAVRLRKHSRAGYKTVERLVTELPGTLARDTENAVRAALALAQEKPVQGWEYFDISCLALILDVADNWLADAGKTAGESASADSMDEREREMSEVANLDLGEVDEIGEDDGLIRAKWTIDGAETLAEAAQKAREFADHLQGLHDEGNVLRGPVADDYGFYYKP